MSEVPDNQKLPIQSLYKRTERIANQVHNKLFFKLFVAIFAFAITGLLIKFIYTSFLGTWLSGSLALIVLVAYYLYNASFAKWRAASLGILLAVLFTTVYRAASIIYTYTQHPHEWDFFSFWYWGRAAVLGLNFYDPEQLQQLRQLVLDFSPSDIFLDQVLAGFLYPPPTMFYFIPLGWLEPDNAYILWQIVNSTALVLSIYLLWKIFFEKKRIIDLIFVATLLLLMPATRSTIDLSQTTFIVLLMVLLIYHDWNRRFAGIWIAIGIMTKPILAIFLLYLLLKRQWEKIVVATLTMGLLSLLAIVAFGPDTFFDYFLKLPSYTIPAQWYEDINQSLLAAILRLKNITDFTTTPLTQPMFILLGGTIFVISCLLIFLLDDNHTNWAISIALLLGLLIYPANQNHYSVLLIAPVLVLYVNHKDIAGRIWSVMVIVTIVYAALRNQAFISNAVMWLAATALCASKIKLKTIKPINVSG